MWQPFPQGPSEADIQEVQEDRGTGNQSGSQDLERGSPSSVEDADKSTH